MPFDYNDAKNSGYDDKEIESFLRSEYPAFDFDSAKKSGYELEEISSFLSSPNKANAPDTESQVHKEDAGKSIPETALRTLGQYGLGTLGSTPVALAYDIAAAPLASKPAQLMGYREELGKDVENLLAQKATGVWSEEDQKFLDNAIDQLQNPHKSIEYLQSSDISLRGLIEKATGLDLHPEGWLEKAANWAGFIKDPKKIFELGKSGLTAKEIAKAIAPTGEEVLRGAGAGVALNMAEKGDFGPIGTLAAAVVGDISGNLAFSAGKVAKKIITDPRTAVAEAFSKFTPKDQKQLQRDIIKDFRDAGIQADIGTITGSDLSKLIQSRLAQSGLTGKGLDELKDQITTQFKDQYKALADSVGEARYATTHEAGNVVKTAIEEIKDKELSEIRNLYKESTSEIREGASVNPKKLDEGIKKIEDSLMSGQLKSPEQKKVLEVVRTIRQDMQDSEGNLLYPRVKDLINNKIALNDIIDYEVQGGAKQLLKGLVADIDRAIISYGEQNPRFAKKYVAANKKFSQHAKEFRNKSVSQLLRKHDAADILKKMDSVQGINDLKTILEKTEESRKLFNSLARLKLDSLIGDNMVDSVTHQLKYGTFAKMLDKPKTRETIQHLLPKQAYSQLRRLQKMSGTLAESAQKFFNASKSGITLEDAGVISKVVADFANLLSGNPWPLLRTGAGIGGARYLTRLISNPEFLRLVEDLVLATESNNKVLMDEVAKTLSALVRSELSKKED